MCFEEFIKEELLISDFSVTTNLKVFRTTGEYDVVIGNIRIQGGIGQGNQGHSQLRHPDFGVMSARMLRHCAKIV